ncbi:hypothetical protein [Micromonospora sp. NPDC003241]
MTDPLAALLADADDPDDLAGRVRRELARRMARGAQPVKRCSRCCRHLPALAFAEDASKGDGLKTTCRECDAARQARARASPTAGA